MNNTVKMTAPATGGGESKKLDTELIPAGFNLCTLYGMATIGTQEGGNYGPKNKIILMFEFPQEKRIFFEGDDPKPCVSIIETTFSMHENANLRALVHGMHKTMNDAEASDFDLSSLLNQSFVAQMEHSLSKDGTKTYSNIKSLAKLNEQTSKMFSLEPGAEVEKINDSFFFHISQGFHSENFKNLPSFIRTKLKESKEGKEYALTGGVFNEPDENSNSSTNNSPVPKKRKLRMLVTDFTYEQYRQNWTDEQLVQDGKAEWINDEPVAAPMPESAPAPIPTPAAAPVPSAVKSLGIHQKEIDGKIFSLNNETWNIEEMLSKGWTVETLIQNNHGNFQ